MSPHVWSATERLRQFLFTRVYGSPAKREEDSETGGGSALSLFPAGARQYMAERTPAGVPLDRTICDYVAGMTDRYAIEIYRRVFLQRPGGLKGLGEENIIRGEHLACPITMPE